MYKLRMGKSTPDLQQQFISAIADSSSFLALFSCLEDVYFFMKDRNSRFMAANKLQLEKMGLASEADVIGKSDFDFFPSYMTAHYHADDQRVMESQKPIHHKVELVANPDGSVSWHITSKFPLLNSKGKCIGLAGIMRDLDKSTGAWKPQRQMEGVMDYINKHFSEVIDMGDLARLAGLSISQFDRRFRAAFGQTPSRFLIHFRLTKASQLLSAKQLHHQPYRARGRLL